MNRRLLLVIAVLALSACGGETPRPAIEYRPVEVKVPVPTPCVDKKDIPAEPALIASTLTGDPVHDLDLVSASARRLRDWGQRLQGALFACARP